MNPALIGAIIGAEMVKRGIQSRQQSRSDRELRWGQNFAADASRRNIEQIGQTAAEFSPERRQAAAASVAPLASAANPVGDLTQGIDLSAPLATSGSGAYMTASKAANQESMNRGERLNAAYSSIDAAKRSREREQFGVADALTDTSTRNQNAQSVGRAANYAAEQAGRPTSLEAILDLAANLTQLYSTNKLQTKPAAPANPSLPPKLAAGYQLR